MGGFDFQQLISAFIVLFAVIDIFGAIPIILDLRQKGRDVNATKATLKVASTALSGKYILTATSAIDSSKTAKFTVNIEDAKVSEVFRS